MARKDKTLRHIGVSLSPDKHAAVEALAKSKSLSLQKTVEAALDAFLSGAAVPIPPPGSPSPEENKWIRKLLDLLRSSDQPRIDIVKFALDAHTQTERAKRKRAG